MMALAAPIMALFGVAMLVAWLNDRRKRSVRAARRCGLRARRGLRIGRPAPMSENLGDLRLLG